MTTNKLNDIHNINTTITQTNVVNATINTNDILIYENEPVQVQFFAHNAHVRVKSLQGVYTIAKSFELSELNPNDYIKPKTNKAKGSK